MLEVGTAHSQSVLVLLEEGILAFIARASETECLKKEFVLGDNMLLKTMDISWNKWSMARVTETKSDQNGLVWSIYLIIGDQPRREKAKNIVEQPDDKIVDAWKWHVWFPPRSQQMFCDKFGYHEGSHMKLHLHEVQLRTVNKMNRLVCQKMLIWTLGCFDVVNKF